ncbi:thioredoxin domain-containing protein [Paludibaculum fermentans]|uniref:Thioredoxin domain-containing protein n=1 Tax=Paludibaculum fermentans TaxID=1473598 RepID=A0A7S7SJV8_PALFE|nr:thioredoxin domain-containing protein [Paludibaculum fermentans]QOY86841.1 thioredoxin domain-containing protein [Paludibaculum fermentans]
MIPLVLAAVVAISMSAQQRLVEGKADSPVRVLIFEDLQCSDCAVFRVMLDEKLLPKYGGKVAFEHRDFPLAKHLWARPAALAARYLQTVDLAKAVKFRQETMKSQTEIKPENFNAWLTRFCEANGVDAGQALAALQDPKLEALVQKDFEDGVARGIAHTPTALVNGAPFIETFTAEEISKGIDAALKENGIQ